MVQFQVLMKELEVCRERLKRKDEAFRTHEARSKKTVAADVRSDVINDMTRFHELREYTALPSLVETEPHAVGPGSLDPAKTPPWPKEDRDFSAIWHESQGEPQHLSDQGLR